MLSIYMYTRLLFKASRFKPRAMFVTDRHAGRHTCRICCSSSQPLNTGQTISGMSKIATTYFVLINSGIFDLGTLVSAQVMFQQRTTCVCGRQTDNLLLELTDLGTLSVDELTVYNFLQNCMSVNCLVASDCSRCLTSGI